MWDLKCHIELQTECSLATMAASTMFEIKSTSNIQGLNPPLFKLNGLFLPMAAPRQGV